MLTLGFLLILGAVLAPLTLAGGSPRIVRAPEWEHAGRYVVRTHAGITYAVLQSAGVGRHRAVRRG